MELVVTGEGTGKADGPRLSPLCRVLSLYPLCTQISVFPFQHFPEF